MPDIKAAGFPRTKLLRQQLGWEKPTCPAERSTPIAICPVSRTFCINFLHLSAQVLQNDHSRSIFSFIPESCCWHLLLCCPHVPTKAWRLFTSALHLPFNYRTFHTTAMPATDLHICDALTP